MTDVMLTTFDNTFNPFTEFERWWKEDLRLGHDCCGLLAVKAKTSKVFSDDVNEQIVRDAMNEIVEFQPEIYKIVTENSFKQKENEFETV